MSSLTKVIKEIINKWTKLVHQKAEIKVWRKRDRRGASYWIAFDPTTNSYNYFGSEIEVKMWIDRV